MLPIRFTAIRVLGTSQQEAFEELVCQLARNEKILKARQFTRKGKPDAGVECIWEMTDKSEWGWQAKYFTQALGDIQWRELDQSVKTAIDKHPKLKQYYIAIPVDRSDARIAGKKSMLEKWNERVLKWKALAKSKGRNVQFHYWGHSELVQALSRKENEGLTYFWFNETEFTDHWFTDNIASATNILLNKRYTPDLNFELEIAKVFDGFTRDHKFKAQLDSYFEKVFEKYRWTHHHLEDHKTKTAVRQIITRTGHLKDFCNSLHVEGVAPLDFARLEALINQVQQPCQHYLQQLVTLQRKEVAANPEKYRLSVEPYSGDIHDLRKYSYALEELFEYLQTITCHLVNSPYLIVTGKAGMGKSHLLADIISNRLAGGYFSLFLLGQHFTSDDPPWSQILDKQLRIPVNEHVFLGALNAKAQGVRKRIVIFIDALNEGNGKNIWPDHLKNLLVAVKRYEWLGLVVSIRSSYEKLIAPQDTISEEEMPRLLHQGFTGKEYEATRRFFNVYDIEQPPLPLLEPEFQNPLFLRLLCEGLHNEHIRKLPDGFWGISKVLDFFISSINKKLSQPDQFDYASSINVVKKAVDEILAWKVTNGKRYIPYEEAHVIAQETFRKYCTKGSNYLDILISEGLFSEDIFYDPGSAGYQKGIYLAYERFEDNLYAAALIEKYIDSTAPEKAFQAGPLFELTRTQQHCSMNQGLLEALSIQLPEKCGKELYELAVHAEGFYPVVDAFVESIPWRKTNTFSDKLLDYINKRVLRFQGTHDKFWDTLIAISIRPGHYLNAEFLHQHLSRLPLGDRDAFWTIYIHNKYDHSSPVKRIIDWYWSDEDMSFVSGEVVRLTAITLGWFFTSCNRTLRDAATKALVRLWQDNIPVIKPVLELFMQCNDPYVIERLYAAAYGAVLRSNGHDGLSELCEHIYETLFNKEKVYPHILLRDYARGINEFALAKKIMLSFPIEKVRPPYKSDCPTTFPTNTEIDRKYTVRYNSKKFKSYHSGPNAIVSSMATEHGRGGGYGDFGRYTFQRGLDDFEVNPNKWSNWAIQRIFELGYDGKKHGEFDSEAYHRSNLSRGERIGKKYQWMVFYEVMARVADNFAMFDRSRWDKKTKAVYDGPWSPYVRDIDPTILIKKTKAEKHVSNTNHWWFAQPYAPWDKNNKDWMASKNDFPDVTKLIQVKDEHKEDWLVLEMHPDWQAPKEWGQDHWNSSSKRLWYQLSSFFVKAEDLKQFITWGLQKNFFGSRLPKSGNRYEVFYRECYWSAAYRFFQNPYYEGDGFRTYYDEKLRKEIGKLDITSNYYYWEEEFDSSKEEPIGIMKPSAALWNGLGLKQGAKEGDYVDQQGKLVAFDPSVSFHSLSCLVIRKDTLVKYLQDNKLAIFWTVLGEKQILGNHTDRFKENAINGFFYLDKKNKLAGNLKQGISRRGN